MSYDVAIVSDLRFPGGTSTSIAAEIAAQAAAGYRTALIQVKGAVLKYPHPINPAIRACIDRGLADLVDPRAEIAAATVIAHNPLVFDNPIDRPLSIAADQRLLIVDHPPLNGDGEPQYDCKQVDMNCQEALGGDFQWAPVAPAVRRQFAALPNPPRLHQFDWVGIIDPRDWQTERGPAGGRAPVIGRHSRPDPLKWPDRRDDVLAAYPDRADVVVRILGDGPFLRDLAGPPPANWQIWPFNAISPRDFLAGLDFFVYFHSRRWVESFGRAILEALASGALAILPPHFRELFEDAAVFAEPSGVVEAVRAHWADPAAFAAQTRRGLDLVNDRFAPHSHAVRLRRIMGLPKRSSNVTASPPPRAKRRILFIASNGVGIGHVTRLLAIARRCSPAIAPVFASMSQAINLIQAAGYHVEYIPSHRYLDCDMAAWNWSLGQELTELIEFYDPPVIVFDGNVPYRGLLDAVALNPYRSFIWCRRAMWPRMKGADLAGLETAFDAVIEPREVAAAFDIGVTRQHRALTRLVDPITLVDAGEFTSRAEARATLGLDPIATVALLQLGSGNNFDAAAVRSQFLAKLAKCPEVQVAVAEWPNSDQPVDLPASVRRLQVYPLSRYLNAFDFVVSAVGYNSFHELILARRPAIFVPNENPEMDNQLARAVFAERQGMGLCLRSHEIYRIDRCLAVMLDPNRRMAFAERCGRHAQKNGADEAALIIEELAFAARSDRRIRELVSPVGRWMLFDENGPPGPAGVAKG